MYFSVVYLVELIVKTALLQDFVYVVTIGIGNEYLTKLVTGYQLNNLFYTLCIQLIEDIIKQE
jgi:hypothetical protein